MIPLTILLLTYGLGDRREYAYRTLHCALDLIRYDGPLFVHIADDGSEPEHRSVLSAIAGGYAHVSGVSVTNAERGGYGRSFNLASQAIHPRGGLVLPLEDDWLLTRPLDVTALAPAFGGGIDCIRLGYLGWTQQLRGWLISAVGQVMMMIDPESPEPHVAAGHPRIETVEYQRRVGPWAEGLAPGMTEFDWCRRPEARIGVVWPLDLVAPRGDLFAHIGTFELGELMPEGVSV